MEFKIYYHYFIQFLKSRMAYRLDFLASVFSGTFLAFSGVLFILLLMNSSGVENLKGWDKDEVIFIYGYSMIPTGFFSILSRNLWGFGDRYVIEGQYDRVLLRPLSSICQVIFESFNFEAFGNLIVGSSLLIYGATQLELTLSFVDYLWLSISSICGAFTLLCVFLILASFSFTFEDRIGIVPPFYNLMQFGRYPITIYNRLLQAILQFLIPVAFISFYPATHFLNKKEFIYFCYLSPLVAVLWYFILIKAWRFGEGNYSSVGN